jgi:small subunit ribosomal protein S7
MAKNKPTKSAEQLLPDPKFGSKLLAKFTNCVMERGKKAVAFRIMYDALDLVSKRVKDKPSIEVFEAALNNIKPNVEVRSRRVGGSNYQVPMPVNTRRQQSLAIRWIIDAARGKKGRPMAQKLASEIVDAFNREGAAWTARENVHKMAEANKAFAHFAWR